MKITFEVGDVVVLKSGGPWMTVTGVAVIGRIKCQWFDVAPAMGRHDGELHNGHFDPAVLAIANMGPRQ